MGITSIRVIANSQLGNIVADNTGRTLYRYDRDRARPSATTCAGTCARTWPPVRYSPTLKIAPGVDPAQVGSVRRPDGSLQRMMRSWRNW